MSITAVVESAVAVALPRPKGKSPPTIHLTIRNEQTAQPVLWKGPETEGRTLTHLLA